MAEKRNIMRKLVAIGEMLLHKRKALGSDYKKCEKFIELRSQELFGGNDWISPRHLANIELGKNWISIEKLLLLADALEINPVELFSEIVDIYKSKEG